MRNPVKQTVNSLTRTSKTKLRILEFSDVHLFHRQTPTVHILRSLYAITSNEKLMKDIDLVIIAGDVFDNNVFMHHTDIEAVYMWIKALLTMCAKYNIVIRVLEGTPGHDWKQSQAFEHVRELSDIAVDLRHVVNLEIEHIDKFNMDVLYIPDEWRVRCSDTWIDVEQCLQRHNLTQVDLVVMHGAFPHQLPKLWDGAIEMHNPDLFIGITKYLIFVGHIHLYSQYLKIVSSGSTERLSHGEEGPKGYIVADIYQDDTTEVRFIENSNAYYYKTVDLSGLDVDACDRKIDAIIAEAPDEGHIRIVANPIDAGTALFSRYKAQYKHIHWTFLKAKELNQSNQMIVPVLDNKDFVKIPRLTRENIGQRIMERIKEMTDDPSLITQCKKELEACINDS